jgi:hypothetical protein
VNFCKDNDLELCIRDKKIIKQCNDGGRVEINFGETGQIQSKVCNNLVCYAAANVHLSRNFAELVPIDLKEYYTEPEETMVYTGKAGHPSLQELSEVSGFLDLTSRKVLLVASDSNINIKMGIPIGTISTALDIGDGEDTLYLDKVWTAAVLNDGVSLSHLDAVHSAQVLSMMEDCVSDFIVGDTDV